MIIEGTVDGRRFSLDYSGDRLKSDFEDKRDEEFFMDYNIFGYHPEKGPGEYSMKDFIGAQACIDNMIGVGIDVVITKGFSEQYSEVNFE